MWFRRELVEVAVPGREEPALAAVITPLGSIVVGHDALVALREDDSPGDRDRELLADLRAVKQADDRVVSFVFRATDAEDSWRIDRSLPVAERDELAYRMYRGHARLNRALLSAGIHDMLYVEWPGEEIDAFARATARFAEECQDRVRNADDRAAARLARLDIWIARNLGLLRALPLGVAIDEVLPSRIRRVLAARDRLAEMTSDLPPGWDQI